MQELTVLEQVILTAIWSLKDDAYGVSIRKEVKKISGRNLMYGTLYNALDQMRRKDYVVTKEGSPTPNRRGRSKIYYHLTPRGEKMLRTAYEFQEAIWASIPDFIED